MTIKTMAVAQPDSRSLTWSIPGGGRKKLKKKEREALLHQHGIAVSGSLRQQPVEQHLQAALQQEQQEPGPRQPVDDDEDIFGDAGRDYAPTLPKRAAGAVAAVEEGGEATAEGGRKGGYFGGENLAADLPPLPGEAGPTRLPGAEVLGAATGPSVGPPTGFDAEAAFGAYPDTDAAYAAADAATAAVAARQEKIREKERRAAAETGGLGGSEGARAQVRLSLSVCCCHCCL